MGFLLIVGGTGGGVTGFIAVSLIPFALACTVWLGRQVVTAGPTCKETPQPSRAWRPSSLVAIGFVGVVASVAAVFHPSLLRAVGLATERCHRRRSTGTWRQRHWIRRRRRRWCSGLFPQNAITLQRGAQTAGENLAVFLLDCGVDGVAAVGCGVGPHRVGGSAIVIHVDQVLVLAVIVPRVDGDQIRLSLIRADTSQI